METVNTLVETIQAEIEHGKPVEEIRESLRPFWGKDSRADERVAESLASVPHVTVANLLQRLLEDSRDKRVQRMIKRSLYRLKGKGIVPEEASLPKKEESILRPLHKEPVRGYGSGIDPLGNRLLMMALPRAGRGVTVIQGLVGDVEGLIDFSGQEMTRKGFKTLLEEIQEKSLFPMVETEASYVAFLFKQAYQRTLERKETPPQDYPPLKGEIEHVAKGFETPLIYSFLRREEIEGDDRILERGGDLLKADLFLGWRIEEDHIRPYADAALEAEESKLVLNPAQKEARLQEIYFRALSELFPEERRVLYQHRLEEMAYVLFKLGRIEEAKLSFAMAIDLEKPLNPIRPNPFLHQLVIQSILTLLKEVHEKQAKEPSVILRP